MPTATVQVGQGAEGVSLGQQLVWVANTQDDTVSRVDRAAAQTVGDPIGVGDAPTGIFVGSKVWVTNFGDGRCHAASTSPPRRSRASRSPSARAPAG